MKKILPLILTLSLLLTVLPVRAADGAGTSYDEFPYCGSVPDLTVYTYRSMSVLSGDEAAAAGVPEGYTDNVMLLTGGEGLGVTLDFSAYEIPMSLVRTMELRVCYPSVTSEVRITVDTGHTWVMRHKAAMPGSWETITLDGPTQLQSLRNEDGCIGVFNLGFRSTSQEPVTAYVDYVRLNLVPADDVPPVLTYNGETVISVTAGKPIVFDASAYDENEQCAFPVEQLWSEGALDADGLPVKGEHTCRLQAVDSFGNAAVKDIRVTVRDKDAEAPVIIRPAAEMKSFAGVRASGLRWAAADNEDAVTVDILWPDGALDARGRLLAGTHTVTLVSVDLTGNRAETQVTLIVTAQPEWPADMVTESR